MYRMKQTIVEFEARLSYSIVRVNYHCSSPQKGIRVIVKTRVYTRKRNECSYFESRRYIYPYPTRCNIEAFKGQCIEEGKREKKGNYVHFVSV